jgi:LytR cell envelope-related transcriptional attenuator
VTWLRRGLAALGVVVVAAAAWRLTVHRAVPTIAHPIPGERVAYTAEVLNGTDVDDLARLVTLRLREAGIDVVYFGTAATPAGDTTMILVRSADASAGAAVREALGLGSVRIEPDPHLLLDVSVVLGRDASGLSRHP